jgi:hypothetical protein
MRKIKKLLPGIGAITVFLILSAIFKERVTAAVFGACFGLGVGFVVFMFFVSILPRLKIKESTACFVSLGLGVLSVIAFAIIFAVS